MRECGRKRRREVREGDWRPRENESGNGRVSGVPEANAGSW